MRRDLTTGAVLTLFGRPTYSNTLGHFLYYADESTALDPMAERNWRIGPTLGGNDRLLRSYELPYARCPEYTGRWAYYNDKVQKAALKPSPSLCSACCLRRPHGPLPPTPPSAACSALTNCTLRPALATGHIHRCRDGFCMLAAPVDLAAHGVMGRPSPLRIATNRSYPRPAPLKALMRLVTRRTWWKRTRQRTRRTSP